ncbi:MAG: hypothetical protein HY074_20545 [Deltaproteobacteria bacterium]|nr:hypothetical protein [Deltaproteobacteria bacterium]
MKGTIFQRPLEFNLQVEGETWSQGDAVKGTLVVKNHGPEAASLAQMGVHLAMGKQSKVRQRQAGAFKIQESVFMDAGGRVEPGSQASLDWKFQTDRNCPITDNLNSLFLLYGCGNTPEQLGALELNVHAYSLIQEYLKTLNIQFRFILKTTKASQGRVEAKFTPPSSQGFASIDHVLVYFRFEGEELHVSYVFQVKKLEVTAASFGVDKKKKEFTQQLAPALYLTSSGRVNHEGLEASIKEALSSVENKMFQ